MGIASALAEALVAESGTLSETGAPVTKVNNETLAKKLSKEKGLPYGHSVFSKGWFIGPEDKLKKAGVVKIKQEAAASEAGGTDALFTEALSEQE